MGPPPPRLPNQKSLDPPLLAQRVFSVPYRKNDLEVNNLLFVHRPSSFNLRKTERNIKQLRLMTIKEDGLNLCF